MQRSTLLMLTGVVLSGLGASMTTFATGNHGERPVSVWTCASDHPVKGNFTTHNGEPCIYHVPGGSFYARTKPERCYATENEARADGCRRSSR